MPELSCYKCVVTDNFTLSFLSIFVHISSSAESITSDLGIMDRSFSPAELEYR